MKRERGKFKGIESGELRHLFTLLKSCNPFFFNKALYIAKKMVLLLLK